ncbi:HAD family acid phosphatase [Solirubrobacter soli]|uniref:HAD family acid phosphatase n=1 Tax=Solirubrobacter soli TaxID=363832 RepID=UPI00040F470C|nr:HAD family acid phosphatase [Solirubrobacter soli]
MRARISIVAAAAVLVTAAAPAAAQVAPAPKPIVTTIDRTPMVELYDGGGGLPYLGSTTSYNAGDWENALRTYHDSGTYLNQVAQIDKIAQNALDRGVRKYRRVKARAARHGHDHGHGGNGHGPRKPAIVLDIDETSLSNYSAINADNFTFGPNSQAEATNEIGVAIPGTLALYQDAISKGVAVFFITGRGEATRPHTEHNLQTQGFTKWNAVVLKPAGSTLTTVAYKSAARADIEKQGYEIVANVGDQYSDLAGGHADVTYKLANPFYFLP